MKDEILDLLCLCLQAQEKGYNIDIEFCLDSIRLYHFESKSNDYKAKILKSLIAYYNTSYVKVQLNEMETYLRELI